MASNFPAYVVEGAEHSVVREYGVGTAFVVGSFVVWDTSNNDMDLCGADPALIAGISEVNSADADDLTPDSKVPVRIITSDRCVIALASATTPAVSYIGDRVGLTLSSGIWLCDVAKTTTTSRATVMDVDITNGIFFVNLSMNALQFAGDRTAQS